MAYTLLSQYQRPATTPEAQAALCQRIADRAAIDDIRGAAIPAGGGWLDTRSMLDLREHSPLYVDIATEALLYAELRGLIERHNHATHLVRVVAGA